jgi:hypothetical protein
MKAEHLLLTGQAADAPAAEWRCCVQLQLRIHAQQLQQGPWHWHLAPPLPELAAVGRSPAAVRQALRQVQPLPAQHCLRPAPALRCRWSDG